MMGRPQLQRTLVAVSVAFSWAACSWSFAGQAGIVPASERREVTQLVMLYFGSTNCAPCHNPEIKKAVRRAQEILDQRAVAAGYEFVTIGVSLDADIRRGFKFLKNTGRFNEVIIGPAESNTAVLEYLIRDPSASLVIPQVVVVEREIRKDGPLLQVSEPRIVAKAHGTGIIFWVNSGATPP